MNLLETKKQVEQMNEQEFQSLFFHILKIANTKYNMSFFLSGILNKNKIKTIDATDGERELKHLGCIDLQGSLDNVNIREFAYE